MYLLSQKLQNKQLWTFAAILWSGALSPSCSLVSPSKLYDEEHLLIRITDHTK